MARTQLSVKAVSADAAPATVIRQARSADKETLSDFFAGLSTWTRYLRFFAPVRPTAAMLRTMTGSATHVDSLVAERAGVIIGHAMATDLPDRRGTRTADIAVVVGDSWQGQGVGPALVRTLIADARERGVTRMTMDVLRDNHRVLGMIGTHWPTAHLHRSADCVTAHVGLTAESVPNAR